LSSRRIERKVLFVYGKVLAQVDIAFSIGLCCVRTALWRAVPGWKVSKVRFGWKTPLKA
jgi:hypothetical protein